MPNSSSEATPAASVRAHRRGRLPRILVAFTSAVLLILVLSGVASAHALLARSDPKQEAVLTQDQVPSQARLWFTEDVNPVLSKVLVVDQNNHEVDRLDSQVSSSDTKEIDVGLHQLGPGAYVVIWRTVSAIDGHAAGGSFIFRVRFPDGTLPALPGQLPTGPAGSGATSTNQCLTGSTPLLCVPQVASDWLILGASALWVGGLCWLIFMVERAAQHNRRLVPIAVATARRFQQIALIAVVVFLVANITYIMGQAILAGGDWGSAFSPTLWGGIVLHSTFGRFWLVRQIVALLALLLLVAFPWRQTEPEDWSPSTTLNAARLALALLFLVALALSGHAAAAQGKGTLGKFAVPVDLLHLLSTSLWVGGLLFIALVLFPAVWEAEKVERAQVLVKLLPRFSLVAIISVLVASLSGSFNATVQLNSVDQILGTAYGRTLVVKTLLFLAMVAISAYHAFLVRPALSRELVGWEKARAAEVVEAERAKADEARQQLAQEKQAAANKRKKSTGTAQKRRAAAPSQARLAAGEAATLEAPESSAPAHRDGAEAVKHGNGLAEIPALAANGPAPSASSNGKNERDDPASAKALPRIERLSGLLRLWIQREAALGAGVLLCASLLAGLAGTLTPPTQANATGGAPSLTATTKTPVDMTQTQDGLQVTFKVTPDTFGTNTFGVLVQDASGKPINGASVHLVSTMLDMDMGTQALDLKGQGNGFYIGQGDLTMGGHWQMMVQVRVPADPTTIHRFTFLFTASF